MSGHANVQSRNTAQKQREEELRSAQMETEAMQADAHGDHFTAELIRIRADYEQRIKAAIDSGNPKLANELRKQGEMKIIEATARETQRRGR